MAAGWIAVTVPAVLAERIVTAQMCFSTVTHPISSRQRQTLLSRLSELVSHNAYELILLLEWEKSYLDLYRQLEP